MITPDKIIKVLLILLLLMLWPLIGGQGGYIRVVSLSEELADIKTAVSEAVTNAIIHGYGRNPGIVTVRAAICRREFYVEISDTGIGIEDVCQAMVPLYTTRPDMERSGMGFSFMEAFMDELEVHSAVGEGTRVRMKKQIGAGKE